MTATAETTNAAVRGKERGASAPLRPWPRRTAVRGTEAREAMHAYALEMRNITKTFPGVKALDHVNLKVRKGEIHALCGENGAGKSTLMKVLSGFYPAGSYEGEIVIHGEVRRFQGIKDAERAGIAIIHQELALVQGMSVAENLFLGSEPARYGIIDEPRLYAEARRWLDLVGLSDVSPNTPVSQLGIGQQQLVEIAKALAKRADILILDEPTAALTESEVERLLRLLEDLRAKGVTCIYISHKLNEVFRLADTITVLRDGKTVGTYPAAELDENRVIALMVGRELTERFPRVARHPGDVVLSVRHFSVYDPHNPRKRVIDNVSFTVRKGEIVGIAGLMGAGRTELVSSLFGAFPGRTEGEVVVEGTRVRIASPRDAIAAGLALVPEDRKQLGLVLGMDVKANISMANLQRLSRYGVINENEEIRAAETSVRELRIKAASLETPVSALSGGNQQKVVLGKWLLAKPKVLLLDEPTRGIDVGAKYELYTLMNELVRHGVAIVMVSSELPEILGMSDRILVMREGRIVATFNREDATQENIMLAATGGVGA